MRTVGRLQRITERDGHPQTDAEWPGDPTTPSGGGPSAIGAPSANET